MASLWSRAGSVLLLALLCACASAPTPAQRIDGDETAALAPLKKHYPDIVVAFDLHGTRLDIAIDANTYDTTDDDVLAKFRQEAASDWQRAWRASHPRQHAALTVRMRDFMGRTWATEHVKG